MYRLRLSNITSVPLSIWSSLPDARVVSDEREFLGTVRDLVAQKWNESSIEEPGETELELGKGVWPKAGEERAQVDITAVIQAFREFYFGHLPVQTRGLHDAQNGGLLTREIKTGAVVPARIAAGLEEGWHRIDDPADLAVQPGMLMAYRDVMPTTVDAG